MELLFFFFSSMILTSGLIVITARNPIHSVLFMILVFVNVVFILIFLEAEFLALTFVIVYVGAVAVLFLFVVMMLNVNEEFKDFPLVLFISIISFLFYFYLNVNFCPLGNFFYHINWFDVDKMDCLSCVGYVLYSDLMINFIEISIVLMIAMVGAIALNFTSEKGMRDQEFLFQSSRSTEISLFIK